MRLFIGILLLVMLPVSAGPQREVELGIKETTARLIPLAIAPFQAVDGASFDEATRLEQLVVSDLEFSGLFKITRAYQVSAPVNDGEAIVEVNGVLGTRGGETYFEGRVLDISSGQQIGGRRYGISEGLFRRIAHHFSDEIVRMLTGEPGIASTKIVFRRKTEDNWELVTSDYDGYDSRVIVRQGSPILYPKWVAGTEAVVYTSFRYGKADLFLRNLAEPSSKLIANYEGLNYSVEWSDKRNELVATLSKDGDAEIYLLSKDGKVKRRLTHSRSIDCSPSWSPSGREVAFTSDRSGTPQIYAMGADGSNVRRLTFFGDYNESPAWSPKGDLIAFVSRIDGLFQLCTIQPDGTEFRMVTSGAANHEDPRWAPNGRHLVFSERRAGQETVISIIDIATGGRRILSRGQTPDWSRR